MTRIRKAIFPVAGLGTRFLPATKAMPKEMLPVVDRPLIQHVVDEAQQAGIEHLVFVTGRNKSVIEDHFDRQFELEVTLIERGKTAELELLSEALPEAGTVSFALLFERVTLAPPVGAAWVKVTVQVLEAFGPRLLGLQDNADTETGAARLTVVFAELPL